MKSDGAPIGFDVTALEMEHQSGVGCYTLQLLRALAGRRDGWHYTLLANRELIGNIPEGMLGPVGPRFPYRWIWMQFVLPRILKRYPHRLCHFTNSLAPLMIPCPFVITLHDMSLFLHPEMQPARSRWLVRSILPSALRRAAAVIAVSHSAKRDILKVLKLPPEKVHVIYEAAAPQYRVLEDMVELERVKRKYGLYCPFVLFVGTLEPRKNLPRLLDAFAGLRAAGRPEQLVIAGRWGWKYLNVLERIEKLRLERSVRLLGYVDGTDLPALYNLAMAVAYPSVYEGFGIPILEGMACGTPVLTSNCSSMAELAAGAALLADPQQTEELKDRLFQLVADEALRKELRVAGLSRASQFSWQRAAEATARLYRQIQE